ncbi:MAG: hypothetical protein LBK41_07575 [Clostridiales bacterium]|jgi:hypothetical protein|nr:hypothetical protein [Clostridiales bacterium]
MDWLNGLIEDWLKQGLIDAILEKFQGMFDSINYQIGDIAANVGKPPDAWDSNIFSMVKALSDTVILPIAGIILTFVVTYELIQMVMERNNMRDFDTMSIYKWIVKTFIAVYILTHAFDIIIGVFGLAQSVVNQSAGVITGSLDIGAGDALVGLEAQLQAMGVWELMGLWLETFIVGLCLQAMTICIFVVIFGRMIEIYLTVSLAPIPLATMANREWGQMGNNYLKSLFAVAFQGFLIMVCVAIYAALAQNIPNADNAHAAIWTTAGYTVLLCFALFKTGSLAKSVFNAH